MSTVHTKGIQAGCGEKETQTSKGETQCSVCYTELDLKNTVITPCNHAFCNDCFFKWLGRKETCALCRTTLLPNTLVEERLTELEDIQDELASNYRCLRRLKSKVRAKKRKLNQITNETNSLLNRQIRIRCLLEQTRSVCRETLSHNRHLKTAMKLQKESLELMKNYRKEWEELHTPIPISSSIGEDAPAEEDVDLIAMTADLDNMLMADRRTVRTYVNNARLEAVRQSLAQMTVDDVDDDDDDDDDDEQSENEEVEAEQQEHPEQENEIAVASETEEEADNAPAHEFDLTVIGTGIPMFSFTTPPARRMVALPGRPRRNRAQSPMFIFGQQSNSSPSSAFTTPNIFRPIASSSSNVPRVFSTDWRREENSWPLNPGHTAMRRLFASPSPSQTDNEEKTGE